MSEIIDAHVLKHYAVERKVGAGSYGHVWRCAKRPCNNSGSFPGVSLASLAMKSPGSSGGSDTFALKKVCDAFDNSTDAQRTFREVVILLELSCHPNIIRLYDIYKSKDRRHLYLVFDYVESDLQVAISANILQHVHQQFVVYQILCALKFLHSASVVHRDLKPSNVLLNESCAVKLCDFGFARSVIYRRPPDLPAGAAAPNAQEAGATEDAMIHLQRSPGSSDGEHCPSSLSSERRDAATDPVLTDGVGTRWYRAPEILFGSTQYDHSVDLWSVGCILGEMICSRPIFAGESILHQLQLIFALLGRPTETDLGRLAVDCRRFAKEIMPCVTEFSELPSSERARSNWAVFFFGALPDALNLLRELLRFVAGQRVSAEGALTHTYVRGFRDESREFVAERAVQPPLDDNTRFGRLKYLEKIMENFVGEE